VLISSTWHHSILITGLLKEPNVWKNGITLKYYKLGKHRRISYFFLAFAGRFFFLRDISFHAYKYITTVVHFEYCRWLPYSSEAPETISLTLPTPVSLRHGNSRNCTWWMTSLRTWGWLPSFSTNQVIHNSRCVLFPRFRYWTWLMTFSVIIWPLKPQTWSFESPGLQVCTISL